MKHRNASAENLWLLAMNLKRLRKERGWSKRQLARRCGFQKSFIVHIEHERVNVMLRNLEILAIVLKCSLYDLFAPIKGKSYGRGPTHQSQS